MKYILGSLLIIILSACTGKENIPPEPPKEHIQLQENRTLAQMQTKLKKLRKPMAGMYLSTQKRNTYRNIDNLLKDTRNYRYKVDRFYKDHPASIKKHRKSKIYKVKIASKKVVDIELPKGDNNASQLKYY